MPGTFVKFTPYDTGIPNYLILARQYAEPDSPIPQVMILGQDLPWEIYRAHTDGPDACYELVKTFNVEWRPAPHTYSYMYLLRALPKCAHRVARWGYGANPINAERGLGKALDFDRAF